MKNKTSLFVALLFASSLLAQEKDNPRGVAKSVKRFNEAPKSIKANPAFVHGTFYSQASQTDVDFFIDLPRGYETAPLTASTISSQTTGNKSQRTNLC
jgi:hypothetical protein